MLLIIGILFMSLIMAFVGKYSGVGYILINMPSILLILVPLLFFFVMSRTGKVLLKYIKVSFKKGHTYTETELKALSVAVKNTIKFSFSLGGFGFMAGGIASLIHLRSPENLIPSMGVSLLSLMYSVIVNSFVFFPVQAWAENKIAALKDEA